MTKIDPRVSIAFKKIFGVEENKDLLISLINSIVEKEDQVKEVALLNPYDPKNFDKEMLSIINISAIGVNDNKFTIEIQINDDVDSDKKMLYFWAKFYIEQLENSWDYSSLSKSIGIHILNFTSILDSSQYHNAFRIEENTTGKQLFDDLELHTIELKKFSENNEEKLDDLVSRIKNPLDIWVAFFNRYDLLDKDQLPTPLNTPALKKALNVLDKMDFDEEERGVYETHLKWLMAKTNTLKKYETKGFSAGLEKGKVEGADNKAHEVAKALIIEQVALESVSRITGLSLEVVAEIAQEVISEEK